MRAISFGIVFLYSLVVLAIAVNGCGIVEPTPSSASAPARRGTPPESDMMRFLPLLDAGVRPADADTAIDARAENDGSDAADSPARARRFARAIANDPETCDDEALEIPKDFIRPHDVLWHLCYAVPTADTSSSPLARRAPETVVFTQRSSWMGEATELAAASPVSIGGDWTASALVVVPDAPEAFPLFNALNLYDEDDVAHRRLDPLWALGANARRSALENHGILRAWRILSDGRRESVRLRPVVNGCLEELTPEVLNGGSFLPDGETCPEEYYLCAPGRFHCDYEP